MVNYRTPTNSYSFDLDMDDHIAPTVSTGRGGRGRLDLDGPRHPAYPTLNRDRPSRIDPASFADKELVGVVDLKEMIARHKMQRSPSSGRRDEMLAQPRGNQGHAAMQLQLARQGEEIERLTVELRRAKVESETVRRAFLSHIQSNIADKEAIEELEVENETLRRRLQEFAEIEEFVASSMALSFTADEVIDAPYGKPPRSIAEPRAEGVPEYVAFDCDEAKDEDADSGCAITARDLRMMSEYMIDDEAEEALAPEPEPLLADEKDAEVAADSPIDLGVEAAEVLSEYMSRKESTIVKTPVRCQSEGLIVGFGGSDTRKNGAARMLSKMASSHRSSRSSTDVKEQVGPAPVSSQNLWGLMRSSLQPSKAEDKASPCLSGSPSQRSLWGPRKSNRAQGEMPTQNPSQNSLWGLMRSRSNSQSTPAQVAEAQPSNPSPNTSWSLSRTKSTHSSFGVAQTAEPADSLQNSSWGLPRSKSCQQPRVDQIPEDQAAETPCNSTWGLITPSHESTQASSLQNATWDAARATPPLQIPMKQSSELGTSGDDWDDDEDTEKARESEERLQALLQERATRRKSQFDAYAKGRTRRGSSGDLAAASADAGTRGPAGVQRCSSLMGLNRHSASAEGTLRDYIHVNSLDRPSARKSMRRVDSLCSIPESCR